MTNRDKFNRMNNTEFATILGRSISAAKCEFCCYNRGDCCGNCVDGIEEWLSTPCKEPPADKNVDLQKAANEVTHDNVSHPAHYTSGRIEVIDFIEDKELGFHLGNAVKYISRAGRKNPYKTIEDLRKAAWYINRQIQILECVEND